jgi:hypothetical protein
MIEAVCFLPLFLLIVPILALGLVDQRDRLLKARSK